MNSNIPHQATPAQPSVPAVLSIGAWARQVATALAKTWPAVRLQGELASFTQASSGHWYFSLKDETAQMRAVMFRGRNVLAGFTPKVGDQVQVLASASLYEARGEFQLVVDAMQPCGQGRLYEQFLRLKTLLAAEGLFDLEHKRPLPTYVWSVAVITSPQAAALADVRRALARRCPHVAYTLYPCLVQGAEGSASIVAALQKADAAGHDVLLLCRGGGSLEDLWCFNTEPVVRAVAACHTPTVVGVGHESDTTLAELAADMRAATPTAAAELVSPPTQQLLRQVAQCELALYKTMQQILQHLAQRLDHADQRLLSPQARVDVMHKQLGYAQQRLHQAMAVGLQRAYQAVARWQGQLQALSPQQVLKRGFAYLQTQEGTVLGHVNQVQAGDTVLATLQDGQLHLVAGKAVVNSSGL